MNLRKAALKGFVWVGTAAAGSALVHLGVLAVLARLLSPADFGLYALVSIFSSILPLMVDWVMMSAIIQKRDISETDLSSLFWFNLALGLAVSASLFAAAPLVARFFRKEELFYLISLICVAPLLLSSNTVYEAFLKRQLRFRRLALIDFFANCFAGSCAIVLALRQYEAFSLVGYYLSFVFCKGFLLRCATPWRPRFAFAFSAVSGIARFGINMFGYGVSTYFRKNIDRFFIGTFLGVNPLGLYSLAWAITFFPVQGMTVLFDKVLFPVLSRPQSPPHREQDVYFESSDVIFFFSYPVLLFVYLFVQDGIVIFYGDAWKGIIPLMRILSVGAALHAVTLGGSIFLQAKGRSDILFKFTFLVSLPSLLIAVLVGIPYGIIGVAGAFTVRTLLVCIVWTVVMNRTVALDWRSHIYRLYMPLATLALTVAVMAAVDTFLLSQPAKAGAAIPALVLRLGVAMVLYAGLWRYLNPAMFRTACATVNQWRTGR